MGGSDAARRVPWVVVLRASHYRAWDKHVLHVVVAGVSTPRVVVGLREMRQSTRAAGCLLLCELVVWLVSLPTHSKDALDGMEHARKQAR